MLFFRSDEPLKRRYGDRANKYQKQTGITLPRPADRGRPPSRRSTVLSRKAHGLRSSMGPRALQAWWLGCACVQRRRSQRRRHCRAPELRGLQTGNPNGAPYGRRAAGRLEQRARALLRGSDLIGEARRACHCAARASAADSGSATTKKRSRGWPTTRKSGLARDALCPDPGRRPARGLWRSVSLVTHASSRELATPSEQTPRCAHVRRTRGALRSRRWRDLARAAWASTSGRASLRWHVVAAKSQAAACERVFRESRRRTARCHGSTPPADGPRRELLLMGEAETATLDLRTSWSRETGSHRRTRRVTRSGQPRGILWTRRARRRSPARRPLRRARRHRVRDRRSGRRCCACVRARPRSRRLVPAGGSFSGARAPALSPTGGGCTSRRPRHRDRGPEDARRRLARVPARHRAAGAPTDYPRSPAPADRGAGRAAAARHALRARRHRARA